MKGNTGINGETGMEGETGKIVIPGWKVRPEK